MRPIDADSYAEKLWKLRMNYQMLDDTHTADKIMHGVFRAEQELKEQPTLDAILIPEGGIGEVSDGYHTFNALYYQRMMLFAALVKTYKDRAWKSRRHSDGELCFGGGWFIVGIDTPQGSFTYHYEDKYFDMFDCVELHKGKEWDGHTEDDVTRLLSLEIVRCGDCKYHKMYRCKADFNAWSHRCELGQETHGEEFYCGYGKRRTE